MILICSDESDLSTDVVIDWLRYYNYEIVRLNTNDLVKNVEINICNDLSFTLETQDKVIKSQEIDAVWYRKNSIVFDFPVFIRQFSNENHFKLKKFALYELKVVRDFIRKTLRKKPLLGKSITIQNMNKLDVLICAKEVGLTVPETRIICNKTKIPFSEQIIKVIGEVDFFSFGKKKLIPYTVSLTEDYKKKFSDSFFPTLFQQEVKKEYEVRVFHLNGKNNAMAIFSQRNKKTKTDFRKYDFQNPNRMIPYILPQEIECKVNALMELLDLDTGSIDFIVDANDNYFFLEINPVGQFGMVSSPCNYYLEKNIAESLIELTKLK